jgi:hypothetical protein
MEENENVTEITEADLKAMKKRARRPSRPRRRIRKSAGTIAVRKPAKLKNDRDRMYKAVAKDLRKRMKRISDARARGEEILPS